MNHKLSKKLLLCGIVTCSTVALQAVPNWVKRFFNEPEPQLAEWQEKLPMTDQQAEWVKNNEAQLQAWEKQAKEHKDRDYYDIPYNGTAGDYTVRYDWTDAVYAEKINQYLKAQNIAGIKVADKKIVPGVVAHTIEPTIAGEHAKHSITLEEVKKLETLFTDVRFMAGQRIGQDAFRRSQDGDLVLIDTKQEAFSSEWDRWNDTDYEVNEKVYRIFMHTDKDYFTPEALTYVEKQWDEKVVKHPLRDRPWLNFIHKPIVKLAAGVTAATVALSVAVYQLYKKMRSKKDN
ncbi:hypothetical protein IPH25_04130 [bacterium]|nr:MAG: hypothetical protein IPG37_01125 [bacterium]QQR61635.1 MAG: hypothetical protein IPH25_04130 [bacterium]QQR62804.1 MAG: hypothetical protein IPH67_05350 [bacterium]